jgi:2-polyprenyl-6-methoxyphenol hydroxylase-like FAD-dependent oxidoreductase
MSFLRGDLERVLFESLPGRVEMRFGLTIEKVTEDPAGVRVTFSDGACETADLLVGADGLHSRTREIVFGDECQFLRYLGYHTAAYVFEDREVREALGADFVNLGVPDRNAGFYAVRGGKIASFFVHRAPDGSLTDAPCEELWQTYGDLGWILPRALAHCPACARVYYDQVAQVKMHQWSRGRVTLIGDACCAVSLLAGQGASIAIAAAFVLAVELRQARAVEEALFRYEDRLRPVVARQQRIGVKTAKWLVPSSRWMMKVRDLTLNLSRTPALSGLLRPLLAAGKESVVDHEHSRRAELLSKSS